MRRERKWRGNALASWHACIVCPAFYVRWFLRWLLRYAIGMRFAYVVCMRIDKEELQRLQGIEEAAREYVKERENPAPDMTMRRITYERLRDVLGETNETGK